jgi:LysM repeat protein
MPTVLLITEQDRVRRLFTAMEREGLFRLRHAPTLGQGEEEIAVRLPHYVFVENGISGLPAASLAAHLRPLLPEGAEVVLMARSGADSEECREVGGLFLLELSETDEALRRFIVEMIPRCAPPENPLPPEPLPTLPKTAREFLSHEPDAGEDNKKYLLWLIPLVSAVLIVGAFILRAGKAPSPSPPKTAAVATKATVAIQSSSAPGTVAAPGAVRRGTAESAAPTGPLGASSGENHPYLVQPHDNLLRVMVRKYGFTSQEALGVIPELKRLNKLSNLDLIQPGQTIFIPARKADKQAE